MKKFLFTCAMIFSFGCKETPAQPGNPHMTPIHNLGLIPQQVEIPQQFKNFVPANFTVNLPPGYKAKIFFSSNSLAKSRFMTWSADSVLHITDMSSGQIIALPDNDHNGAADASKVVATGVFAHSIQFYNGALYAAETGRVLKLRDTNEDGVYETKETFVTGFPSGGGHSTRTIVFDGARKKMYLSIGSSCNVCRENDRANIMEFNDDGTGGRIIASGVRNAVGMTLHPVTGKLWANNNGSDNQGNDIPPEWFDIVRDGGFYGWPIAYHTGNYFNFNAAGDYKALLPVTASDSAKVRSMVQPGALYQAHSAPMGVEFANNSFPAVYRNGAFMALRGSWNYSGTVLPGYRLVYFDFDNAQDTIANSISDFVTGFQVGNSVYARPVGLALDNRGNIFLGSDANNKFIMFIYRENPNDVGENPLENEIKFSVTPSPAVEFIEVKGEKNNAESIFLSLSDLSGKEIFQQNFLTEKNFSFSIPVQNIPNGTYLCKIIAGKFSSAQKILIAR